MEKMMKPAEYAKELGISRQAVYAKIKRGILTAKNVEGKLYIIVDKIDKPEPQSSQKEIPVKPIPAASVRADRSEGKTDSKDYKALLNAKDETISVLKGTVKDLKKSNKQISSTLKGEIDLLKEAFYEMRTLYVRQLEQKKPELTEEHKEEEEAIDVMMEEEHHKKEKAEWISLKKFFKQYKITKEKQQEKIEKQLKKAAKQGDKRVRSEKGKLKLNNRKSYGDILK